MSRRLCAFLAAAFLTGCASEAPPPTVEAGTERTTRSGPVLGFASNGGNVWRGIPYAAPPVGDLRWRPPQPVAPWSEPRASLAFGPQCPQFRPQGEFVGEEDCLYLNVFAPSFPPEGVPTGSHRLPVMFFIHGGGNSVGSADMYDGARLAVENRVVVVTVNYRLGLLGWFSHPSLREGARTRADASGNWATLDLVAALRWVRNNAEAFGGDPSRVTIFGESAGGVNVFSLLLAKPAKGLFHRAIAQSGLPMTITRARAENAVDDAEPGHQASSTEVLLAHLQRDGTAADREAARAYLDALGPAETEAYLRGKSATELLAIFAEEAGFGGMYRAPYVIRDGDVMPDMPPLEAFAQGRYHDVPVVMGSNRDENKLFFAFTSPHVRKLFGLPIGFGDADRYDLVAEYGSNLWKAQGVDEPAAAMRRHQASVFGYRFDWDEMQDLLWLDLPRLFGAAHGIELLFVFGATDSDFARRWVVDEAESAGLLSERMRSYWAQLAATGAPGRGQRGRLPLWEPWSLADDGPRYLVFDTDEDGGLRMASDTFRSGALVTQVADDDRLASVEARCEVYQHFARWSDALDERAYASLEDGSCPTLEP